MTVRTVAMLTAGGLAPCLSSAVGGLIERYTELAPDVRDHRLHQRVRRPAQGRVDRGHPDGAREGRTCCTASAARPIGNSRVKLTNVADCVKRGLVAGGPGPAARRGRAAHRRRRRRAAHDRRRRHQHHGRRPRRLPARERLRADRGRPAQDRSTTTSCRSGSRSARGPPPSRARSSPRTSSPSTRSNPRMLIVHEVMGRNCGWLTAATAEAYHNWVAEQDCVPGIGNDPRALGRPRGLRARAPDRPATPRPTGCAPSWTSSAASTSSCPRAPAWPRSSPSSRPPARRCPRTRSATCSSTRSTRARGSPSSSPSCSAPRRRWCRSRATSPARPRPTTATCALIKECTDLAVDCALRGEAGVIGHDEERGDELRAIEFPRIKGGKAFDATTPWFTDLLGSIGQG